ncbi:MAG: TIGR04013 family B12-binding domain/radical SAM domain-containing protein [Candidatus Thorarchaeota archaeon]
MDVRTLLFRFHPQSRYSIAALTGAIEIDQRLVDLEIHAPLELPDALIVNSLEKGGVIIAHSVMSTQLKRVVKECQHIRNRFGNRVLLVAGGPHASARPKELLKIGFDYVVIGEGEKTFPELLYHLMNGKDPSGIEGLVTKESTEIPSPRERNKIKLDEFPPFALKHNLLGPIEVTRGCPFKCKFCSTPFLSGGIVRHRSVENIIHWLSRAVSERGFKRTWFLSPNALSYGGHGGRAEPEKLEKLLKKTTAIDGLEEVFFGAFPSEVRPEFVSNKILRMMREYVANHTLQIGIQSGSDRVLEISNRHHSVEDGLNAANIALANGFTPHIDMIFGLPGETIADRHASLEICYQLIDMGAKIHAHVFMPLPGSAFENEKPGILDQETRRQLGDLARRHLLTGSWSHQEILGKELASKEDMSKR